MKLEILLCACLALAVTAQQDNNACQETKQCMRTQMMQSLGLGDLNEQDARQMMRGIKQCGMTCFEAAAAEGNLDQDLDDDDDDDEFPGGPGQFMDKMRRMFELRQCVQQSGLNMDLRDFKRDCMARNGVELPERGRGGGGPFGRGGQGGPNGNFGGQNRGNFGGQNGNFGGQNGGNSGRFGGRFNGGGFSRFKRQAGPGGPGGRGGKGGKGMKKMLMLAYLPQIIDQKCPSVRNEVFQCINQASQGRIDPEQLNPNQAFQQICSAMQQCDPNGACAAEKDARKQAKCACGQELQQELNNAGATCQVPLPPFCEGGAQNEGRKLKLRERCQSGQAPTLDEIMQMMKHHKGGRGGGGGRRGGFGGGNRGNNRGGGGGNRNFGNRGNRGGSNSGGFGGFNRGGGRF